MTGMRTFTASGRRLQTGGYYTPHAGKNCYDTGHPNQHSDVYFGTTQTGGHSVADCEAYCDAIYAGSTAPVTLYDGTGGVAGAGQACNGFVYHTSARCWFHMYSGNVPEHCAAGADWSTYERIGSSAASSSTSSSSSSLASSVVGPWDAATDLAVSRRADGTVGGGAGFTLSVFVDPEPGMWNTWTRVVDFGSGAPQDNFLLTLANGLRTRVRHGTSPSQSLDAYQPEPAGEAHVAVTITCDVGCGGSQPSSVGTEATCPVVVAHTLARWRMPLVRPGCPCTWVVPLVGLGSTLGGGEGAG